MSDALIQQGRVFEASTRQAARPAPQGYGLLAAATVSLGLWGGIFWIASRLLG